MLFTVASNIFFFENLEPYLKQYNKWHGYITLMKVMKVLHIPTAIEWTLWSHGPYVRGWGAAFLYSEKKTKLNDKEKAFEIRSLTRKPCQYVL